MQTFLPYPDFHRSCRCLDDKRLGKQRVEAKTLLNILLGRTRTRGWAHHPAKLMWQGYENALKIYYNECLKEWMARGFRNRMKFESVRGRVVYPPWLGDERFHASHRSNLLRKDPEYYRQFGWREPPDLPYFWPTKEGD